MPACKNLIGQKFGRLTVIEKTNKRKNNAVIWKCLCDCGNEYETISSSLTKGRTKSCGCLIHQSKFINLEGKKFGRLTPIEPTYQKNKKRSMIWKCKCDCGNMCEVTSENLNKGHTTSCGCLKIERWREVGKAGGHDYTGRKFGKLTAVYLTQDSNHRVWHCKCDCGNECDVPAAYLRNGHTKSCGCLKRSYGEYIIKKLLEENFIAFETEKQFKSCIFPKTGRPAKFDFFVENTYIIEFDGPQHYEENYFLNNSLEELQARDMFKNKWCVANNIPIIRIPYWISNNITIEDLLLKTSQYLWEGEK